MDKDNTIRFGGEVYQLERKPFVYSYTGKKAEIRYLPNKPISIYIDGELVKYKRLLTVSKETVKSGIKIHGKVAILYLSQKLRCQFGTAYRLPINKWLS